MEQNIKPTTEETLIYIAIKYKNAIISVLVLILFVGAGTFFWVRNQQTREQEASQQLSRIAPFLDQGDFAAAINGKDKLAGLKKIADTYAGKFIGTPSGNMANLLLANAYYSIGDFDNALKVFKSVSLSNNDLAAASLAGAGDCYFNKNQFEPAADNYREAAKKTGNTVLKAQYLAHEASSYQESNQLAKAAELYNKIIADYPGTPGAAIAQNSLLRISGNL